MALISNVQLRNVLDKLTRFASMAAGDLQFDPTFTAGIGAAQTQMLQGGDGLATYILGLNSEDVAADLLPAARDLDEQPLSLSSAYLPSLPQVTAMLAGIASHLRRYSSSASLDAYLTSLNTPTPTLRAHGHFTKYLAALSPGNVFIPVDLDIATFAETGATAGTFAHLAAVDLTKHGPAQLVVRNTSALTTSAVVSVTAKKADGTTSVLTATLTTHTINTETPLSDVAQNYIDVTAIAITTGTSGDTFKITAKTDRSLLAA